MYDNMSPTFRWVAFGILLVLFLVTGHLTSREPNAAGIRLMRLELCATTRGARDLLREWSAKPGGGLDIVRRSTRWDFLFILSYVPLTMLLCAAASHGYQPDASAPPGLMYWFGLPLCWAVAFAGLCDVVENLGMFRVMATNGEQPWPAITATASAVKWCIVAVAFVYCVIGFVCALIQWMKAARPVA